MSNDRITWTNERRRLRDLVPWPRNPRQIKDAQAKRLAQSFDEFGQVETIAIGPDNEVYNGHQRLNVLAAQHGHDYEVDVRVASRPLSEKEREKLTVFLHRGAVGEWDFDTLANEFELEDLLEWGFEKRELDLDLWLPDPPEDPGAQMDKADELHQKWGVESGQLWQLGEHRLICGDCTDPATVARVMNGEKARTVFTDPPYGIGKKIENDNLRDEDWRKFYALFTDNMLNNSMKNAYVFVWGYFDTLSDYWQEVIKPRGDCLFRNFIIWRKKNIQGRNDEDFRQYPEEYEAALVYIFGQPFRHGPWTTSPNAEYYPEIFEPIRKYLDCEREKMGWDVPTIKRLLGHSDLRRDHWFGRSQWEMPSRKVYEKLQQAAHGNAFHREYDELRREYDELRKEHDELRRGYNEFRGYFNNTNGFTDLWEFERQTLDARHPTVKPVETCERAIITTSQTGEIVLDIFVGSGTTIVACERLGRKCRAVEISPAYCAVAIQRWADMTGKEPVLLYNGATTS